jgi:intracellular sulfur oxidation DsrE/DsrF family protein
MRSIIVPAIAALALGVASTAALAQSPAAPKVQVQTLELPKTGGSPNARQNFQQPVGTDTAAHPGGFDPKYASGGMQHVVYHIDFLDNAPGNYAGLGNIKNHLDGVGDKNIDLIVVMNGQGISLVRRAKTDEVLAKKIDELRARGVKFEVCSNTISREDWMNTLYGVKASDIVAAGVGEVAWLQSQGYSMVKVSAPIVFQ